MQAMHSKCQCFSQVLSVVGKDDNFMHACIVNCFENETTWIQPSGIEQGVIMHGRGGSRGL